MEQDEQLEDWYVRYHSIFGKRYTRKRKDRFLESLSADIRQFRSDVELDTFKLNEKDIVEYKNLYVGDIKKQIRLFAPIMILQQLILVRINSST